MSPEDVIALAVVIARNFNAKNASQNKNFREANNLVGLPRTPLRNIFEFLMPKIFMPPLPVLALLFPDGGAVSPKKG